MTPGSGSSRPWRYTTVRRSGLPCQPGSAQRVRARRSKYSSSLSSGLLAGGRSGGIGRFLVYTSLRFGARSAKAALGRGSAGKGAADPEAPEEAADALTSSSAGLKATGTQREKPERKRTYFSSA